MPLVIAVVGTGWWGMELGKAAATLPDRISIAGCTSPDAAGCERFRTAYGGTIFPDLDAVLSDPSVHAVVLATPHSLHWTQVIAAARAGKHVFCEKPFTLTTGTARAAIEACKAAGVVLGIGHNRRYMPGARQMKALVDDGTLGQIIHIEAQYSGNVEGRYPPGHWRVNQDEVPNGAMTHMGLHMVDTLTWILGPFRRVIGLTKHQALTYPLDDTCCALFELASGVTGQFTSNLATAPAATLRIFGTRANVEARGNFSEVLLEPGDPDAPRVIHRHTLDDSLAQELAALADACAGRAPFPVAPGEAYHNVAFLEAVGKSAKSGNVWVDVPVWAGSR